MTVAPHPKLTGMLVDVTHINALYTSHMTILSTPNKQVQDYNIAHMFGMAELQLRIGGRPVTYDAKEALVECYQFIDSAAYLCKTSLAFLEPVDDEPTAIEAMDDEKEDDALDEVTALMMFDRGYDES